MNFQDYDILQEVVHGLITIQYTSGKYTSYLEIKKNFIFIIFYSTSLFCLLTNYEFLLTF